MPLLPGAAVRSSIRPQFRLVAAKKNFATTSYVRQQDRVLLLDDILLAQEDLKQLERSADVVRSVAKDRKDFIEEICSVQPKALYRHFGGARSVKITGKFDAELVSRLPSSLQFISHNGAGYDQLDIKSLTEKQIQVSNVPTVVDDSTATTALWLLIGALRQFNIAQRHLAAGTFNSQFPFKVAQDPGPRNAKVLGIIGAGGIGQEFARKASAALNMEIVYHNRKRLSPEQEAGMTSGNSHLGPARYVSSLDELLQHSDAVSVHCPFTPATKHLISARQLGLMKPSAVLINTARGPIVDEESLVMALEHGKIAGVGLDVFEHEPKISEGLLKHERALLLPHVGTLAYGTQQDMERFCLHNIIHALQTGKLKTFVPEQRGLF